MISVKDRILDIPPSDVNIGFVGDNKIEIRQFEITEIGLFDFDFKLDLKTMTGSTQIVDLVKTVEADKVILMWEVLQGHIAENGLLDIQLRAFNDDGEKWHSNIDSLNVKNSINATDYFPSPLPSEFEQMEQRVTAIQMDVTATASEVEADRAEVAQNTQTVIAKAAEALQSAVKALASEQVAKQSEDNAKGSESNAYESKETASQALSDLLSMMGSDIATLTGGKLTPSQIPAIAVTDTFVVNTEGAMLALVAETGDVCIRTDESKTYILQGSDPAILANWQHLKTPTNYADTAGHATTADEATNATMINGHRIVYMTQAQYDVAVKDAETVYMVGV